MLIPASSGGDSVLADNIQWSDQWAKRDPSHRKLLKVDVKTTVGDDSTFKKLWSDFAAKFAKAAAMAGDGGEIILFTGHGHSAATAMAAGGGFLTSGIDTTPDASKDHSQMLVREDLQYILPKAPGSVKMTDAKMDVRKKALIDTMRPAIESAKVARLTLLTCDAGQASGRDFITMLAGKHILNVEVKAYRFPVASGTNPTNKKLQLYVLSREPPADIEKKELEALLEKQRPKTDDAKSSSYGEIPDTYAIVMRPDGNYWET
jgi:hypothetical protein